MPGEHLSPGDRSVITDSGPPELPEFSSSFPRFRCIFGLKKKVAPIGSFKTLHGETRRVIQAPLSDVWVQVDDDKRKRQTAEHARQFSQSEDADFLVMVAGSNPKQRTDIVRTLKNKPRNPDRTWRYKNTTLGYEKINGKWCEVRLGYTDSFKNK